MAAGLSFIASTPPSPSLLEAHVVDPTVAAVSALAPVGVAGARAGRAIIALWGGGRCGAVSGGARPSREILRKDL